MKNLYKNLFIISGILPATYLLGLTMIFLSESIPFDIYDLSEVIFFASMIFGIAGYVGLIISLISKPNKNYFIKLVCLTLGVAGFTLFVTKAANKNLWDIVTAFEELDEWFIFIWPNIVSLVLIFYFAFKSGNEPRKV